MTAPTVTARDARDRRSVRLPDGRTGRVLYVPIPSTARHTHTQRSPGAKARVVLPSGVVRSVDPALLVLVDEAPRPPRTAEHTAQLLRLGQRAPETVQ
jgi:hypothetical protein